jgi:hypothetical protein
MNVTIKLKAIEPDFIGQGLLQNTKTPLQNTTRNNFKADII